MPGSPHALTLWTRDTHAGLHCGPGVVLCRPRSQGHGPAVVVSWLGCTLLGSDGRTEPTEERMSRWRAGPWAVGHVGQSRQPSMRQKVGTQGSSQPGNGHHGPGRAGGARRELTANSLLALLGGRQARNKERPRFAMHDRCSHVSEGLKRHPRVPDVAGGVGTAVILKCAL